MFLITWVFDKLGYMPKIDTQWSFPAVKKPYTPHEFEQPKKAAKKVVKKTATKTTRKKV